MVKKFTVKIVINGIDRTKNIVKNYLSMNIIDNANNEADEFNLTVSGRFKRPQYKDEIKVYIGYEKLFFLGLYRVENTTKDSKTLSIKATGVNFGENFKVKRNITYKKVSIKDIVSQIAQRHELKVKSDYDDYNLDSQAQTNESDMHFLNRLAKEYNAIFNVKNDTLYFMQKHKDNKKNEALPHYKIDANKCLNNTPSITYSNKTLYNSCEVSWHDTRLNKTITKRVPIGGAEPILKINGSFQNEAEAIAKAKAKLQRATQGIVSGDVSKVGEVIYSGGTLEFLNHFEEEAEPYQIEKVIHDINKQSGWTTNIKFER